MKRDAATQYVAFLRGINVGGNNLIKMDSLRACLEKNGFQRVATCIQSGNVLFESDERNQPRLEERIQQALFETFNKNVSVLVRSRRQLKNVVSQVPEGFGAKPNAYRYDVIFLKLPLTAAAAMKIVSLKEGVDHAFEGNSVLYFSRLTSRASQSRLSRIIATQEYKNMTIRNWNTTTKLLALLDAR